MIMGVCVFSVGVCVLISKGYSWVCLHIYPGVCVCVCISMCMLYFCLPMCVDIQCVCVCVCARTDEDQYLCFHWHRVCVWVC